MPSFGNVSVFSSSFPFFTLSLKLLPGWLWCLRLQNELVLFQENVSFIHEIISQVKLGSCQKGRVRRGLIFRSNTHRSKICSAARQLQVNRCKWVLSFAQDATFYPTYDPAQFLSISMPSVFQNLTSFVYFPLKNIFMNIELRELNLITDCGESFQVFLHGSAIS